jgi:hypothetical protein
MSDLEPEFDEATKEKYTTTVQCHDTPPADLPESDTAFGATKEPELRNDTRAVDIKAMDIERWQQEARDLVSDAGRLKEPQAHVEVRTAGSMDRGTARARLPIAPRCHRSRRLRAAA